MKNKIGCIGLGNMGYPMAKNIEKAGFEPSVYNRTKGKAEGFESSTSVKETVEDLVAASDIIFTILTNDQAVEAVYEQIVHLPIEGKLFVDMSTISVATSLKIKNALVTKEADLIDAPVAGSTQPAKEGTLIIMVGGEEKSVEAARPYLEKLGKMVKHLGENGKGLAAKISINYFLSMIYQGLGETILLSDSLGVNRADMLEIINNSASGSGATKVKTPLLLEDNYTPAFALDLMLKDVRLAESAGADFPLGKAIVETFQAAHDAGLGQNDVMGIINYLKK